MLTKIKNSLAGKDPDDEGIEAEVKKAKKDKKDKSDKKDKNDKSDKKDKNDLIFYFSAKVAELVYALS